MNPPHEPPRRYESGPADSAGFAVLGGCAVLGAFWYVAVSRLHLRSDQCFEIFLDLGIGIFGIALLLSNLMGRRAKREEMWPHPAMTIPGARDAAIVESAIRTDATVLGYNVHKEPWLWPDAVRIKHGVIAGGTGAGKTTFLENIVAQDLRRRFGNRSMPMIIFDGKGDQEFLERLLPHIEAAGRLQDLRVIDPSNPRDSARYNPFYSGDALYQEHVNFIFQSFGLREDFFKGHQEAYLSDLVRILYYAGKIFNVYDVLVIALDEKVLAEQIARAKARIVTLPEVTMQMRLNFEMSVRMIKRSLADRDRVEKIQGLLNELLAFLEDELSIVTGSYQDLLAMYAKFCVSRETANDFIQLFVNRRAYGMQAGQPLPNGSVPYYLARDWQTKTPKPLDLDVVRMHLNGDITINLYAINPDTQRSKWVAIDADFDGAVQSLCQLQWELKQDGVEAALEQSRRGGHLWIFGNTPLLAAECRIYIYNLALRLGVPVKGGGLKEGIEVFPRQDRIDDGEYGNAIRAPLGVHRKTNLRYWFYDAEVTPEAQLAHLNSLKKLTEEGLKTFIQGMSLPEAYKPAAVAPYIPIISSSMQHEFRILEHVRTTRKGGRNLWARCPSCAQIGRDRTGDNLAIQIKNPRLYKCWAGCTKEEIRAALGQPIRRQQAV